MTLPPSAPLASDPLVWVLADDRAGHANQALGVAEALGLPFVVKTLAYSRWANLPNLTLGKSLFGLSPAARTALLSPPWPNLVVAAGRRTVPPARWIKSQSGGKSLLCQIMWPGSSGIEDFDLVAVPEHDALPRTPATVFRVPGAPHRVTPERLTLEGLRWGPRFASIPRPLIALLVGGSAKNRIFSPATAHDLGRAVSTLLRSANASLAVATSPRTSPEAVRALLASLPEPAHRFLWGEDKENPYFGYLALADAVVVTGDSASMASEACARTGPVFIYAPKELVPAKHARLHAALYALDAARPLGDSLQHWEHPPLNAAAAIAARLRRALDERALLQAKPPLPTNAG